LDNPDAIFSDKTGSVIPDELSPTDDDGYAVPPDSPSYDVLEDPDEQTTDGSGVGSSVVTPTPVPGPSGVAGTNRYVTKQRRRPPSPPRKIIDGSSSGNDNRHDETSTGDGQRDVNDGMDGQGKGEGSNDKNIDYESLKEDNADESMYQPLDRKTMLDK
jgi:hypothetical protein